MPRKKPSFLIKHSIIISVFFVVTPLAILIFHYVEADNKTELAQVSVPPNVGVEPFVREYFIANDAAEMLPIIECESGFNHYEPDRTTLKNRAGSSAIGIAQILASAHPDPTVLKRYNREYNTDLTEADFDITTLEGNLGYALVLYKVNGTRDWECAKFI